MLPAGDGQEEERLAAVPFRPRAIRPQPQAFCAHAAHMQQATTAVGPPHTVAPPQIISLIPGSSQLPCQQLAQSGQLVQMIPHGGPGFQPAGIHILWPSQQITEQLVR